LWDFFATMTAMQENLCKCSTLKDAVRETNRVIFDFTQRFPKRKSIRDGASHPIASDLAHNTREREKNALPGNIMISLMNGRTVVFTIDKEFVEYELSQKTFDELHQFQQRFYLLFGEAERLTRQMWIEKSART